MRASGSRITLGALLEIVLSWEFLRAILLAAFPKLSPSGANGWLLSAVVCVDGVFLLALLAGYVAVFV